MPEQLATVWLLHAEGRRDLGHTDATRAWEEAQALPGGSHERAIAFDRFNPVEIGIRPEDVPLAIERWERVAGIPGVCVSVLYDRRPGQAVNHLYRH